ncbi:hypothetical protein [Methylobacterium nigriterrae]|uniref:hypothetical protein n=1 Tax=Methylobacterium nigriterrae TaxID=3127512 RepID=UPI003013FCA2
MPFEFRKLANVGTRHPVMARLSLQSGELLKWLDVEAEVRDEIGKLYMLSLTEHLLRCHEHRDTLFERLAKSVEEVGQHKDPRVREVPHVSGLDGIAEGFLVDVKKFLRDLLTVFQLTYGYEPKDASDLADVKGRGYSDVGKWAESTFGPDDNLTAMLKAEANWVTELVKMRNAVEHPADRSGTLTIRNVRLHPDGDGWVRPTWQRTGKPEQDILSDMDTAMDSLLTLAEEVLVAIVLKRRTFEHVTVFEVPEASRDPICPIRFVVNLEASFAAKVAVSSPPP